MSTSHNLVVIYGFPADDIGLTVPTMLGCRSPSLNEWLAQRDAEEFLHHFGRVNGGDNPTPFIGVVSEAFEDVLRNDLPGFMWRPGFPIRPPSDQLVEALGELHGQLQAGSRIGYYVMLGLT